jgi:hypothetical protein
MSRRTGRAASKRPIDVRVCEPWPSLAGGTVAQKARLRPEMAAKGHFFPLPQQAILGITQLSEPDTIGSSYDPRNYAIDAWERSLEHREV